MNLHALFLTPHSNNLIESSFYNRQLLVGRCGPWCVTLERCPLLCLKYYIFLLLVVGS